MTVAAAPPPAVPATAPGRARAAGRTEGGRRIGEPWFVPYLFLLPHFTLFGLFILFPFLFGIWISLNDWDLLRGSFFIGLDNYRALIDPASIHFQRFWDTLWNTVLFVIMSTPLLVLAGLLLATLLNQRYRGRNVFRAIYFAPWTLSAAVVSLLWWWIFAPGGLADLLVRAIGLTPPQWLTANPWAWLSILITTLWWTIGFNTVILLAGMQAIAVDLYEAASIDGANKWQTFRHITIPSLRPILLLVTTLQVIASFNLVAQPQIMTGGGPPPSETMPVLLYIYNVGFTTTGPFQLGAAASMALVVALIMIVVSVVNFRVFGSERG